MHSYGEGDCLSTADSCLLILVGITTICFGVGYGIWKVVETLIA